MCMYVLLADDDHLYIYAIFGLDRSTDLYHACLLVFMCLFLCECLWRALDRVSWRMLFVCLFNRS